MTRVWLSLPVPVFGGVSLLRTGRCDPLAGPRKQIHPGPSTGGRGSAGSAGAPLRGCRFPACRRPGTRWRSRRPVHRCSPSRNRRLASTGCCRKQNASCRRPEWRLVAHPVPAIRTRRRRIPRLRRNPRPGNNSPRTSASTPGCVRLRPRRCCPRCHRARPHRPRRRHDHRRCPRCRQRPRARRCSPRRRRGRRCHPSPSFRSRRCRPFRHCYRRRRSHPPRRCCHPLRRCDHPRQRSRRPHQAPRCRWSTRTRRRDPPRYWPRPPTAISGASGSIRAQPPGEGRPKACDPSYRPGSRPSPGIPAASVRQDRRRSQGDSRRGRWPRGPVTMVPAKVDTRSWRTERLRTALTSVAQDRGLSATPLEVVHPDDRQGTLDTSGLSVRARCPGFSSPAFAVRSDHDTATRRASVTSSSSGR